MIALPLLLIIVVVSIIIIFALYNRPAPFVNYGQIGLVNPYAPVKFDSNGNKYPCTTDRVKLLDYLSRVYFGVPKETWQLLTLDQLKGVYCSLSFLYNVDGEPYTLVPEFFSPKLNSTTSPLAWNGKMDQVYPFDYRRPTESILRRTPNGTEVLSSKGFWGDTQFANYLLNSMRKGMRNSAGLYSGKGAGNKKYGVGGFPSNVYIEMLMYPQEHNMNMPKVKCGGEVKPHTLYEYKSSRDYLTYLHLLKEVENSNLDCIECTDEDAGCRDDEVWTYYSSGTNTFFDLGNTCYAYNQVDAFLNAPVCCTRLIGIKSQDDPVGSMQAILYYLVRQNTPTAQKTKLQDPLGYPTTAKSGLLREGNQSSFNTTHALHKQVASLMGKKDIYEPDFEDEAVYEKRDFITGWCNGQWYGYPKNHPLCPEGCAPFGYSITNGATFTYTGPDNEPIFTTWKGKKLAMSYQDALALVAEMYSTGDTGWDDPSSNSWPFGSYFSYGQDLGVSKYAIGQTLTGKQFNKQTLQFTSTPTSLSKSQPVIPAYDFEVMIFSPQSNTQAGLCEMMKSINILSSPKVLETYTNSNVGLEGGYVDPADLSDGDIGPFRSNDAQLSNWSGSPPPTQFSEKTNQLKKYCNGK